MENASAAALVNFTIRSTSPSYTVSPDNGGTRWKNICPLLWSQDQVTHIGARRLECGGASSHRDHPLVTWSGAARSQSRSILRHSNNPPHHRRSSPPPSPPSCRSPRAKTTARALHSVIHRASTCSCFQCVLARASLYHLLVLPVLPVLPCSCFVVTRASFVVTRASL